MASNLAVSISQVGRKVLLIGMDIRKPALGKIFKELRPKSEENTVVDWLVGRCTDMDALVSHSETYEGLDVIFAGVVPPNPTELLTRADLAGLIGHFRDKYDYIVIDSAPYLPVSDSSIINTYVDATLYTIRAGVTDLKLLPEINEDIKSETKPMKNVSVILNDLDLEATRYRYGYGYGYGGQKKGYGYGYGRGSIRIMRHLLKAGMYDFVATDLHSVEQLERIMEEEPCRRRLRRWFQEKFAADVR